MKRQEDVRFVDDGWLEFWAHDPWYWTRWCLKCTVRSTPAMGVLVFCFVLVGRALMNLTTFFRRKLDCCFWVCLVDLECLGTYGRLHGLDVLVTWIVAWALCTVECGKGPEKYFFSITFLFVDFFFFLVSMLFIVDFFTPWMILRVWFASLCHYHKLVAWTRPLLSCWLQVNFLDLRRDDITAFSWLLPIFWFAT